MHHLRPFLYTAVGFLALTVLFGLGLRWNFVTGWFSERDGVFTYMRHAHSHAGYYGVLFLALWATMRGEGVVALSRPVLGVYVVSALAASVLFVFYGYNLATIVLSTIVLLFWLVAAWRLIRRRTLESWLDAAPWGVLIGAALIPPVAVLTPRNPGLASSLAHLFLTVMLLGTFIPAAWASLRCTRGVPVLLFYFFVLGASLQIAFPEESGDLGLLFLAGYAFGVVVVALRNLMRWYVRLYWLLFAGALAASVFLPIMQGYGARIAGVHFIILGPVLTSFSAAFGAGATTVGRWLSPLYHFLLNLMVVAILAGGYLPVADPGAFTAWVSTAFVVVLLVISGASIVGAGKTEAVEPAPGA